MFYYILLSYVGAEKLGIINLNKNKAYNKCILHIQFENMENSFEKHMHPLIVLESEIVSKIYSIKYAYISLTYMNI